jgi:hypothetical protein
MITWRIGARKRLFRCCLGGPAVVGALSVLGVGRGGLLGVKEILRYLRVR